VSVKSRWVILLSVIPLVVAAAIALIAFACHPDHENDRTAAAALLAVALDVEDRFDHDADQLERLATIIARDPKFFAMLTLPRGDRQGTDFRIALDAVLQDFQRDAGTPIFAVTDDKGTLLARAQRPAAWMTDISGAPYVRIALGGKPGRGFLAEQKKAYRVVAVPVASGGNIVGTLCVGTVLSSDWGRRLSRSLGTEVVLAIEGQITESTIPPSPLRKIVGQRVAERTLRGAAPGEGAEVLRAGGKRFVAIRREMAEPSEGGRLEYVLVRRLESESTPLAAMGRELLLALVLGLLLSGGSGAYLSISARKDLARAEEERRREVSRLTEIDRMRSGLMAGASGEVLDPATAIRTCADLMAEDALGELTPPQREGIDAIRRSAETLTRLGQDLENLSLIERHELELAPDRVEVDALVEDVVVRVVPLASERRQTLTFEVEPNLVHPAADGGRLSKAVMNLALNAIRFTPEGGKVEIGARRIDRGLGIYVVDEGAGTAGAGDGVPVGAGIPGSTERSGLGLTAAQGIIEAHGGTLRFWSEPGMGSTFTVDLPLPQVPAAAPSRGMSAGNGVGPDAGVNPGVDALAGAISTPSVSAPTEHGVSAPTEPPLAA
jgi:signal transduction histidine kinase